MKRFIALFLCLLMTVSLFACGKSTVYALFSLVKNLVDRLEEKDVEQHHEHDEIDDGPKEYRQIYAHTYALPFMELLVEIKPWQRA